VILALGNYKRNQYGPRAGNFKTSGLHGYNARMDLIHHKLGKCENLKY